ncbi:NirD/YgiW/YdeI family stress tolerance protein [Pseudodesulfovibrio thermohalotolerans]|uniref:NirD/YgiW/YdeI family stress tolerance protein n=1 Tax=Pseudodesulfovibrio thermohalotolerans TaxID=2880651 RepID=UPI0022BA0FBC|nr:NirD/YgiW/YdeI family stress tolerance protein [Pseudodesulfovibrio thermohalotolerans]WFS63128.1 NirD/YgiW/YdeI family stress tolerance protein [Pseudodesulfovibrio thermohalotolerans]
MKRFSLALMLVFTICVATAFAAKSFAGATESHDMRAHTVAEAKASSVDTGVVLHGRIVKVINDNSVLFSDNTGELLVHMQNAEAKKDVITNADVDVNGKIVGDLMYTEVKADSVTMSN